MGALAQGLQGAGQAASDFGQAKFDFADWQQKQRTARLNEIIQGLSIQHIQNQLKQQMQPQAAQFSDIKIGEDGKPYGLNKLTGRMELVPSPQGAAFPVSGETNPTNRLLSEAYTALLGGDTPKANRIFEAIQRGKIAETAPPKPATIKPPQIKYDAGIPVAIEDGQGNTWDVNDPNLPANLRPLKASAQAAHSQHLREQEQSGIESSARSLDRAGQLMKMREDQKIQGDAIKASGEAREARIGLDTAKRHAARKESYSDQSLIYTAVRSNVQGAGRMTQTEILQALSAGSFGDVWKRRYENAVKGTLPEEDRQKILHEVEDGYRAKRQAGEEAWKQGFPDKIMPPWLRKPLDEKADEYEPIK